MGLSAKSDSPGHSRARVHEERVCREVLDRVLAHNRARYAGEAKEWLHDKGAEWGGNGQRGIVGQSEILPELGNLVSYRILRMTVKEHGLFG
jgi:hypothetical protein